MLQVERLRLSLHQLGWTILYQLGWTLGGPLEWKRNQTVRVQFTTREHSL